MAKKKAVEESEEEESEEEQFHVEVITKAKVTSDRKWQYFVKWAGYDSDDNTWEPEHNVQGCERLLAAFWKEVGIDEEDYPVGHIVHARPSWIKKEKAFFAKNFRMSQDQTQGTESKSESSDGFLEDDAVQLPAKRKRKTQKDPKKSTKVSKRKDDSEGQADSDDGPLMLRIPKKRPPLPESDGDAFALSESSTEKPVRKALKQKHKSSAQKSASSTADKKGKARAAPQVASEPIESESDGSLFSSRSSPEVSLATKETTAPKKTQASTSKRPAAQQSSSSRLVPTNMKQQQTGRGPLAAAESRGKPSGITTKMRLAQRAQALTVPAMVPTSASVQRNTLAKLSFKKTSGTGNVAISPIEKRHPLASQPAPRPGDVMTDVSHTVQSPVSFDDAPPFSSRIEPVLQKEPLERQQPAHLPRRSESLNQPPAEPMAEVDQFLSSIMPAELAAPMVETSVENRIARVVPVAPPTGPTKAAALGRIPKKWKWTGELFMDVEEGRAQRLCNVSLFDATDPRPHGLRFSLCLTSADSLRFHKLHEIPDMYMILRACAPVQQFAKLGPQEDEDADTIQTLASHMKRTRTFTYARLSLDGQEVALLLVFPSLAEICKFLKVPPELSGDNTVIAALIPWELTRQEYDAAIWRRPQDVESNANSLNRELVKTLWDKDRKLLTNVEFSRALRILQVPKFLYDFMSSSSRPYCLWHAPADGDLKAPGLETTLLRAFLTTCKAHDVGHKADVRVIFVHVGAISTLCQLPALAERRCKRPEIRFYTYGSHESVLPERWGIREIFPLGGILTFTPSAILENIWGAYELMKKVEEHPLWQCYILPSVIAMLAKLTCQDQSPLSLYDKGEFILDELLELIVAGKVSLLRAPPLGHHSSNDKASDMKWVGWQLKILGMNARGLLEECIKMAMEQYINIPEADLPEAIQKEIARDLWSIQMQPAMMDEYRRLVIVKGRADRYLSEDSKEGVERVNLSQFDFKDDFFAS